MDVLGFGQIVGIIGILSFILAMPMAVLANLLTPKAQVWFANRTTANAHKRLKWLDEQLAAYGVLQNQRVTALIEVFQTSLRFILRGIIATAIGIPLLLYGLLRTSQETLLSDTVGFALGAQAYALFMFVKAYLVVIAASHENVQPTIARFTAERDKLRTKLDTE